LSIPSGPFRIFYENPRIGISNFIFISGVVDTSDETVATLPACLNLKEKIENVVKSHHASLSSNPTASKKI
jgi:hypothetical protein